MCGTTVRTELRLPADPTAPRVARDFARSHGCTEHALDVLDEALLLISELVTNSVRHGGAPLVLALDCDGTGLLVRVRDGATALPAQRSADDDDEGGRGLALLDALSDAWGVEPVADEHGAGKAVWFELRPPSSV